MAAEVALATIADTLVHKGFLWRPRLPAAVRGQRGIHGLTHGQELDAKLCFGFDAPEVKLQRVMDGGTGVSLLHRLLAGNLDDAPGPLNVRFRSAWWVVNAG